LVKQSHIRGVARPSNILGVARLRNIFVRIISRVPDHKPRSGEVRTPSCWNRAWKSRTRPSPDSARASAFPGLCSERTRAALAKSLFTHGQARKFDLVHVHNIPYAGARVAGACRRTHSAGGGDRRGARPCCTVASARMRTARGFMAKLQSFTGSTAFIQATISIT
jgi:hypothetical protein